MNRRRFIGSILALGVAPAIVRADSLMRIVPREMMLCVPRVTSSVEAKAIAGGYWVGQFGRTTFVVMTEDKSDVIKQIRWGNGSSAVWS